MVTLRCFKDKDMALFKKWLYTPHVAKWYHEPLDWIDEVEKRDTEFSWVNHFIVENEEKPIGFCQYYLYCKSGETWHDDFDIVGTYSVDYMIGETDCLRKGYGKEILNALISKIKSHPDAKNIIVQPESDNMGSCGLLKSCGFSFDEKNQFYYKYI